MIIPPANLVRWYQQIDCVDLFFSDRESVRYEFETEAEATKFNTDLCAAYIQSKATRATVYVATKAKVEEPETEESNDESEAN